jgi:hypothetical protein
VPPGVTFSIEQRDRVRDALLERARADARIVAAAEIGSAAGGEPDRWSDLDLTFGVRGDVGGVVADWTRELGWVVLFDLRAGPALYRVFLLPGNLQVDLSFAPEGEFGARGPRFRLLWGEAVQRDAPPGPDPAHLFGLAVHHAVRARICIERGRVWQAEYWIGGVREQAMALACVRHGLEPAFGRGVDRLPPDVLAALQPTLVGSLDRPELLRALAAAVDALLRDAADDRAVLLAPQLRDLVA